MRILANTKRLYLHLIMVALVILAVLVFFVFSDKSNAAVWTERVNSGDHTWISIDSSIDGSKIVAIDSGGYIYTSSDSGVNWTARTGAGARSWIDVASSSDGVKLAAVNFGGYIYTSGDSGATWTERVDAGAKDWYTIGSSSDGSYLVAGVQGGYIYTSGDSGATWTERVDAGMDQWANVAVSGDGTKIYAVPQRGDVTVHRSLDGGATWTSHAVYDGGCTGQKDIAASLDGTKIAVVGCDSGNGNNYVYTSSDSGSTWVARTGSGSRYWFALSMSDNGNVLLATDITSYPYLSVDGGATWEAQTSAGSAIWISALVSGNGAFLATGIYGGKISTAELILDSTPPVISEVIPVQSLTTDNTPSYVFTTDEAGTISYAGGCVSDTTSATLGENTITFNTLSDGTYSSCTITVTDAANNTSDALSVNSFVVDTTAPVLSETGPINETFDTTPSLTFTSSENGTPSYGGGCTSPTDTVTAGTNSINLNQLNYGLYSDCVLTVTDTAGNVSAQMSISDFRVNAHGAVSVSFLQPTQVQNNQPVVATEPKLENAQEVQISEDKNNDIKKEEIMNKCGFLSDDPYILKAGLVHNNIYTLQVILNCKGYTLAKYGPGSPGKETRYFGPLTKKAVLRFQKENNLLLQEAVVGPETRDALNKQ